MIQSLLALDTSLLIKARGLVGGEYALLIQFLGEIVVIWGALLLIVLWLSGTKNKNEEQKRQSLRIFFTIVSVFVVYGIVNFGLPQWRPSPDDVVGGIKPLIPHPIGNSFPSGHALFSAALFVGVCTYATWCRKTLMWITIILGLITTVARVIGGVHYPGDIVGGIAIGGVIASLSHHFVHGKFMENTIYPWCIRMARFFRL